MPILKPSKGEKEKDFISRCMGNSVMLKEFPDKEQRAAVCYKQWGKKDSMEDNKIKTDWADFDIKNRIHVDQIDGPDWMSSVFIDTPEGYLRGRAIITSVGVFSYRETDGRIINELRLPEEVFSADSLGTFRSLPMTNNHPKELVNAENIKEYQVGFTGDAVSSISIPPNEHSYMEGMVGSKYSDGFHIANDLTITDPDTIGDIKSGRKRALSAAYVADLEMADPGAKWCGVPYDFIQRNIRYNHVAVVEKARAGDAARIRLDSADAEQILFREEVPNMSELKKIVLDGVEYQAEASVITALNQARKDITDRDGQIADLKTRLSDAEGKRDSYKEQVDVLMTENKTLKDSATDETEIEKRVGELVKVRQTADHLGIEIKDGESRQDTMKAVILAKFPAAKLDGKDDIYIQSRFDSVVEMIEEEGDKSVKKAAATVTQNDGQDDEKFNADAARQRMIERQKNASRASAS
jgi:hypothetical protein